MDYSLPTSMEYPSPEPGETVTPSPHHPIGAKGIGESISARRSSRSANRRNSLI
jgi:CO/xanthine dehydrogenase Mo-binding subunit